MIRIKITSLDLITRQGRKGAYHKQTAWAFLVDRHGQLDEYPTKIQVILPRDADGKPQPYAIGDYVLHPSSFRVGQYHDLEVGFPLLSPPKAPLKS